MELVKPHWWRLLLASVFMGLVAACTSAVAYLIKPLLDEVFIHRDLAMLKLIPGGVLAIYVFKGVFFFGQQYLMTFVGMTIIHELRVNLYAHMQYLSLSFFHKHPSGTLLSRIINDVNQVQAAVTTVVTGTILDFFTAVGLLFVVFYRDWKLALIGSFVLPFTVGPLYYFGRRLRKLATSGQEIMADMTNVCTETFQGERIVKAFNQEGFETERFAKESRNVVQNLLRSVTLRSISSTLMEALGGVCVAGIIGYGGYEVIMGRSTPGSFISFMTALLLLYEPIKRMTRMNTSIQQGVAAADRVFDILDLKPEVTDKPDAIELPLVSREIEFDHVTFGYKDEEVLHDVNLRVRVGEVLAIVGTSGGGKTTLVNLIPRFYDVWTGAVRIDGHDLRDVTQKSLRNQIAVVSQRVTLFNDTVRNNILYGRPDASEDDVAAAAKASFAHDFITKMPQGYDTVIGERGVLLSGGERQRLAMARALIKNAPILILDEATSSLDTESELAVQRALENLMRGRTTFVIAHRLSTVRNADRIIAIVQGRIVEEGNHDQLMARNGEYRRLYEMQFQVDEGLASVEGVKAPAGAKA
jgi:subfamily B ATP-binding cassette protein MsbA